MPNMQREPNTNAREGGRKSVHMRPTGVPDIDLTAGAKGAQNTRLARPTKRRQRVAFATHECGG